MSQKLRIAHVSYVSFCVLCAVCCVLVFTTGCESLQRKFTRKPKHPLPRPTPVIQFEDYTGAMTPLNRYRKHYLQFQYWNGELLQALGSSPFSLKRLRRASSEALTELTTLQDLLHEEQAQLLTPLIEERLAANRQIQSVAFGTAQAQTVSHLIETQSRQIYREFFWREMEDKLRQPETTEESAAPAAP
ncbi:MAG: hypothetical protein HYT88_00590 [Candidatus Omnitrophica bacterium]|nr:hypothetical protein [Candidatus Omnitrophota bacterium]MBI2174700.1 hypothetical protein [Candidatus Omnitrophota bacterium]